MTRKAPKLSTILWVLGAITALWFAVDGGEYGTFDLLRQRSERAQLLHEIDSLNRVVDSLRAYKQKVMQDPRTQERIAREEFGMVRGKELLYRIAEPADTNPPESR